MANDITIANCSKDEHGEYRGGTAGDQTRKELCVRSWYNAGWNVVMRHPDKKTRQLIAKMAKNAADNDMIGYDQGQRLTFCEQLKKVNYMPEKIRVACEADCSS